MLKIPSASSFVYILTITALLKMKSQTTGTKSIKAKPSVPVYKLVSQEKSCTDNKSSQHNWQDAVQR